MSKKLKWFQSIGKYPCSFERRITMVWDATKTALVVSPSLLWWRSRGPEMAPNGPGSARRQFDQFYKMNLAFFPPTVLPAWTSQTICDACRKSRIYWFRKNRSGKFPNRNLPILNENLQTLPFDCFQKYLREIRLGLAETSQTKTPIFDNEKLQTVPFSCPTTCSRTRCHPSNEHLGVVSHCSGSLLG